MTAALEPTSEEEARPLVTRAGTNRSSRVMSNDYPHPIWPNNVAIVPAHTQRWIRGALKAGVGDEEIAETTGLECEQVTAIRHRLEGSW